MLAPTFLVCFVGNSREFASCMPNSLLLLIKRRAGVHGNRDKCLVCGGKVALRAAMCWAGETRDELCTQLCISSGDGRELCRRSSPRTGA